MTAELFSEFPDLLDELPTSSNIADLDPPQRVYCNRDLDLQEIEAIGFDMDYTLARYNQRAMDALSIEKALERLVSERGYPDEIMEISPRPDFAMRGLVLDTTRGHVLKVDRHRHAGKVYHGFEDITDQARSTYRQTRIRFSQDQYVLIDTLFALPEAFLYAALVDYCESNQPQAEHDWRQLYDDIRFSIDLAHRDESIKSAVVNDLETYVNREESLALTLHKFRSAGKRLFLLTNSYARYTNRVMSYLLDDALPEYESWQKYFDVVITGAGKPAFFTEATPFQEVTTEAEVIDEAPETLTDDAIYQGGSLEEFERLAGWRGDSVLFIGDHIYGDILRSRKTTTWRTAMIVQEMEPELEHIHDLREEIEQMREVDREIASLNEQLAHDKRLAHQIDRVLTADDDDTNTSPRLDAGKREELENARRRLSKSQRSIRRRRQRLIESLRDSERQLEERFNPYWGLIFKQGNENTIFGEQVEDYACLYTSRVSNLLNYSPVHYFRAPRQTLPHERISTRTS
jgi:HAD superfamily 5'-nucleotidase-like hydrolase